MDERKNAVSPRKYAPLIIGALLLAALLLIQFSRNANTASIGKTDGQSADQPASGELVIEQRSEIHVNVSLPPDQYRELSELNQNFMLKFPYIQVTLNNEPAVDKAYESWKLDSQRGEAADIMLLDNSWVRPFAVRGYLQSADNAMSGDTLTDQLAGLLDPLKWNGYLWGVPKDVNPYLVVWNGALLSQAGLKAPPGDWPSYQEAAAKLIEINAETRILNWSAGDLRQQLVWLANFQTDPAGLINLFKFNEAQINQLKWIQSMGSHVSRINAESSAELNEAFLANKLLAAVLPWETFEKFSKGVQDMLMIDRNHIPFPWLNGHSYVMSSSTLAEEEAILWIQEMTGIQNQQKNYDRFAKLPASASLYALNGSIQTEQSHTPPAWWETVLNTNQPADHIPFPDPLWPEKWQFRESAWRNFSQDGFQIDAFVQALLQSP